MADDGDFEEMEELDLDEDVDDIDVDSDEEVDLEDDGDVPVDEIVAADESVDIVSEDSEEEFDRDDDVEEPLDKILEQRTTSSGLLTDDVAGDDDETENELDLEDRILGADGISPKRPGEFTCMSCFLVKHPSQLADSKKMLCRDCA